MSHVITHLHEATPSWLEGVLRRAGALTTGAVQAVSLDADASTNARTARLRPAYSPDASGECPRSLFLKLCANPGAEFLPDSEVNYYTRDYADLAVPPFPRCYDAAHAPDTGEYHLVIQDVSGTHSNCFDRPVTLASGLAIARAMARLHAHRWGTTRLTDVGEDLPSQARIAAYVDAARPGLAPLLTEIDREAGAASVTWRRAVLGAFERHPTLMLARARDERGMTLVHGDPNPGNILAPDTGDEPIYLIDRQPFRWSLTAWLGASDLAYMMVHWWEPPVRRALELSVLREYRAAVTARGVDYAWDDLLRDYRLCAVQSLYVVADWCADPEERERMRWVWQPQLRKAMTAFVDLDCAALWT